MTWSKGEMLKEREPTVMMKKALILVLIFVFCLSSAYAEDNVWVEESWRQIDREVDCDEIQLKIHAKVQEVPEGMEVCRYFLDNPSYDFLIAKGDQFDWAALGCDTSDGRWRKPSKSEPAYTFNWDPISYPGWYMSAICEFGMEQCDPEYTSHIYPWGLYLYETDDIAVKGVSSETIRMYAETIARECGCQLGEVECVEKTDDEERLLESLKASTAYYGDKESLNLEYAAGYAFSKVTFPVYYNGLRLYCGYGMGLDKKHEMRCLKLEMIVTAGHGLIYANGALINPEDLKAVTEPQPVISAEEVLSCIEARYADLKGSNVTEATVQKMTLEYIPICGPNYSEGGYTLYPAWVARTNEKWLDYEGEIQEWVGYEAYDAITGELIFLC